MIHLTTSAGCKDMWYAGRRGGWGQGSGAPWLVAH